MIPNSAIPDAINALAQKAQGTGDDTASKPLAKTVTDLKTNASAPEANTMTPRSMRYKISVEQPDQNGETADTDDSESAASESNTPNPAPSANADVLHPDTAAALEKLGYDDATIAKLNIPQVKAILQHSLPPRTAFTPRPPLPADSPFAKPPDPAAPILAAEPNLDDETRAQAWDIFHQSSDPMDFAKKIAVLALPSNDLKHRLFLAKAQAVTLVAGSPVDKVVQAVQKMVSLDPAVLESAERHPALLKYFTDNAGRG